MKSLLLAISNGHNLIMKLCAVVFAALILAWLFPSNPSFRYEYPQGGTWHYKTLSAPFDFSIFKSEDEVQSERIKAEAKAPVCFKMNESLLDVKLRKFAEVIQNTNRVPPGFSSAGNDLLKRVFQQGIVTETDQQRLKSVSRARGVLILGKKNAEEGIVSDLLDVPSARALISEKLNSVNKGNELSDLLLPLIEPNLLYDDSLTSKLSEEEIASIATTKGLVKEGDKIISKGEIISTEKWEILNSFKKEFTARFAHEECWSYFSGHLLLSGIVLSLLILFLKLFRKDIYVNNKKIILLLLLIILFSAVYTWTLKINYLHPYIVPLCILPIIVRTFFDTRLALYTHLTLVLILGFMAPDGFEFTFFQMTTGMVAIFSIVNLRNRSQFFVSSGIIFSVLALDYFALSLLRDGSLAETGWTDLKWLAGNAMLTLFAYPLIYLTEKIFGFVSDVSLLELSDSNNTLLREFAARAPGTFQHSLQVSNLAEAAIYKIGGNPLMIRAGALYHDIGKMEMPMYFIENQYTGVNPHDEISFEESAEIITSHVIRGIEIAKKNNLPDQLIDFIRTHHGTTMVQYFYRSYLKSFPDEIVDESKFRYPGPLPYSRETAVLMMADSVEAAARSLKRPEENAIENLVESVIENLVKEKQFINCDITFRDISSIKKIFRKMLTSIHHVRVEYPK